MRPVLGLELFASIPRGLKKLHTFLIRPCKSEGKEGIPGQAVLMRGKWEGKHIEDQCKSKCDQMPIPLPEALHCCRIAKAN